MKNNSLCSCYSCCVCVCSIHFPISLFFIFSQMTGYLMTPLGTVKQHQIQISRCASIILRPSCILSWPSLWIYFGKGQFLVHLGGLWVEQNPFGVTKWLGCLGIARVLSKYVSCHPGDVVTGILAWGGYCNLIQIVDPIYARAGRNSEWQVHFSLRLNSGVFFLRKFSRLQPTLMTCKYVGVFI